ncbi:MAG TPA: CAP domain-containing protein, partial [Thermoleophilaceae bacterium]
MSPVPARLLVAVGALLCAALALPAFAPAHQAAPKKRRAHLAQTVCANTDVVPTAGNLDVVRAAILCLNNQERDARGLPPLKENARLRQAAVGHSDDMVEQRYFDHDS